MLRKTTCSILITAAMLLAADPAWKTKPVEQWSGIDAKQLLTSSPWVKRVVPGEILKHNEEEIRQSGMMGGNQGVGLTALSESSLIGAGTTPTVSRQRARPTPPVLEVRWESASPVRAAELKAREDDPPKWDGSMYAIAVYDVPGMDPDDKAQLASLKRMAFLKRDGKKELRPVRVDVLPQVGGLMTVVYLFPRTSEIGADETRVEFTAIFGRLGLTQDFNPREMLLQGKLAL